MRVESLIRGLLFFCCFVCLSAALAPVTAQETRTDALLQLSAELRAQADARRGPLY